MHLGALVNHFVQLHYDWMIKIVKYVNLSVNCLLSLEIPQVFLLVGLDCNHVFAFFVSGATDYSKCTLPDLQADLEFP